MQIKSLLKVYCLFSVGSNSLAVIYIYMYLCFHPKWLTLHSRLHLCIPWKLNQWSWMQVFILKYIHTFSVSQSLCYLIFLPEDPCGNDSFFLMCYVCASLHVSQRAVLTNLMFLFCPEHSNHSARITSLWHICIHLFIPTLHRGPVYPHPALLGPNSPAGFDTPGLQFISAGPKHFLPYILSFE